ncbi:hypothetical protein GCM10022393_42940 [Aquimarina addita]|uniref:Uncharacterized protein n=1 Tax=Aquimarina addita TaxID=870485 RepID=A0ABP6UZF8_9FLAO
MGLKAKYKNESKNDLIEYLNNILNIIKPLFNKNGIVDLSKVSKKADLEFILALLLNSKFISSEDKNGRSFGADDVIALKLEIEGNRYLKYWGRINWLSKPNDHECHKSYQDPFYGLFELKNNRLELNEAMFGDYDKNDLDGNHWIESYMNWMYDI